MMKTFCIVILSLNLPGDLGRSLLWCASGSQCSHWWDIIFSLKIPWYLLECLSFIVVFMLIYMRMQVPFPKLEDAVFRMYARLFTQSVDILDLNLAIQTIP